MQENEREFELYIGRIRPLCRNLFNTAYAITGNAESAEYALQCALLDGWMTFRPSDRRGLRETLRRAVIRAALRENDPDAECAWNALSDMSGSGPVNELIASERTEMRRILALKYGCGLSNMRISRVTRMTAKRVSAALERFERRLSRASGLNGRALNRELAKAVRASLTVRDPMEPDMQNVFRTLQADAQDSGQPSRLPARIGRIIFMTVMAVLLIVIFWYASVILAQPALEDTASAVQSAESTGEY